MIENYRRKRKDEINQVPPQKSGGQMLTTNVYDRLTSSKKSVKMLEGGSRSSKTTSIIQFILMYCQINKGNPKRITIARKRLTWLKMSVFETFQDVLNRLGYWIPSNLNKSDMIYHHLGHQIRFIGLDEVQKVHGMEQDLVWINEAIEADQDDFDQLEQRTTDIVITDFNPRRLKHWLYNICDNRPDVDHILSTIFDNPFAPEKQRKKILSYEPTAQNIEYGTANINKWKIYGLGQRGQIEGLVFPDYKTRSEFPFETYKWKIKGLDFGFTNDPSALVDVRFYEGRIFLREMIYQTGMNNLDLSNRFTDLEMLKTEQIIADSASPLSINELKKLYGWNVIPAKKGQGSVIAGIDTMKQFPLIIHKDSLNLINEFDNYTYKKDHQTGQFLNKIEEDQADHGIDASRYPISHRMRKKSGGKVKSFGRTE